MRHRDARALLSVLQLNVTKAPDLVMVFITVRLEDHISLQSRARRDFLAEVLFMTTALSKITDNTGRDQLGHQYHL